MRKGDSLKVHEVARVISGPRAGMVGVVVDVGIDWAEVLFEGCRDNEPYRETKRIKFGALGRNHE